MACHHQMQWFFIHLEVSERYPENQLRTNNGLPSTDAVFFKTQRCQNDIQKTSSELVMACHHQNACFRPQRCQNGTCTRWNRMVHQRAAKVKQNGASESCARKLHQKAAPKGCIRELHQNAAPEGCNRRLHQKAAPEGCTRMLHPKAAPKCCTRELHQNAAPECCTRRLHQNAAPESCTRMLHEKAAPKSFSTIATICSQRVPPCRPLWIGISTCNKKPTCLPHLHFFLLLPLYF